MSQIIAGARKALRHSDHGDSPQTGLWESSLTRNARSPELAENMTFWEIGHEAVTSPPMKELIRGACA